MALPTALEGIFKQRNKSYKMVLVLSILKSINRDDGLAPFGLVETNFQHYFMDREEAGLPVDQPPGGYRSWVELDVPTLRSTIDTPYKALALKDVLIKTVVGEKSRIGFKTEIWDEMDADSVRELQEYAEREIQEFFNDATYSFSLREHLNTMLSSYLEAKQLPSVKGHPLGTLMRHTIPNALYSLTFLNPDEYKIQGSIGRPNWVTMPWIAIMDKRLTDNTRGNYYVCYVFAENMDSVYLTLKHSNEPIQRLGRREGIFVLQEQVQKMRDWFPLPDFQQNDLASDYSDSNYLVGVVAYKKYMRDQLPSDDELITDLERLMETYNMYVDHDFGIQPQSGNESEQTEVTEVTRVPDPDVLPTLERIETFIEARGFSYPKGLIRNFYLSLKTKPFVILAGISGTGKTKLVKLFAESLGATGENGRFMLIPVRPDWSDPSDLIGYTDLSGQFRPGAMTKIFVEAAKPDNREHAYFVLLDEMNLARVEHYFSDLLSLMETQAWANPQSKDFIVTDKVISTTALCDEDRETYKDLCIPENVFLIGTVNMDETTHPFSKKVLDRANTIEFNHIDLDDIGFLDAIETEQQLSMEGLHQSFLRSDYLQLQDAREHLGVIKSANKKVAQVNELLKPLHAHVGFRVRDAICYFMVYNERFKLIDENKAFDMQLCQKILPRMQGGNTSVQKTLVDLLNFAYSDKNTMRAEELLNESKPLYKMVWKAEGLDKARYPESAQKIAFMLRRLEEDGFTSFWLS